MTEANDRSRTVPVRRRTVVAVALALPVLAGCRVRLEDGAPHIPLVPTREPVADEAVLVRLVAELRSLATVAGGLGPALTQAAAAHTRQADVLTQVLRGEHVPEATISPGAPSASGSASGAPGTPALGAVTKAALAARELAGVDAASLTALANLTTPAAAQVRSIAAYRAALGERLGARVRLPSSATAPASTNGADPGLLQAFRAAAYGLQVAAARSGTAAQSAMSADPKATQRMLLAADADWALGRAREIVSRMPSAPPPPIGYQLSPLPTTAAAAEQLAAAVFRRLELAVGDHLAVGGPATGVVLDALLDVLRRGERWGLALRAFPGLAEGVPGPSPSASLDLDLRSESAEAGGSEQVEPFEPTEPTGQPVQRPSASPT